MRSGNPSPVPRTENLTAPRFQPGQSGNPGGKTSDQRKLEVENAERATRVRGRLLAAIERTLDLPPNDDATAVRMIGADVLRLLKDSEDRGLGAPTQPVDVSMGLQDLTDAELLKRVQQSAAMLGLPPLDPKLLGIDE